VRAVEAERSISLKLPMIEAMRIESENTVRVHMIWIKAKSKGTWGVRLWPISSKGEMEVLKKSVRVPLKDMAKVKGP